MIPDARRRVAAARVWAIGRFPYLAAGLFASTVVPVPDISAVAVDRSWRLYIDPVFIESWTVEELGAVLLHHAGHLLREHADRAQASGVTEDTMARWLTACDAEVNDDLDEEELSLPFDMVLPDDLGEVANRLAEEYFHLTISDARCDHECGSGAHGIVRSWDAYDEPGGISPDAARLLRCRVASDVLSFGRSGVGSVPRGWERWAEGILQPQVDWRRLMAAELRRGLEHVAGVIDYTYSKPSRRASAVVDFILPAMQRALPEIAIVCDTSASMSDHQLAQVLAEIEGLLRTTGLGRRRLRVLSCDAAVGAVQRVVSAQQVHLFGGGGTDMAAGITAAIRLRPKPAVIVILTDGMTPWPIAPPPGGLRVIVGLIGFHLVQPPSWAKTVRIEPAARSSRAS